MFFSVIVPVYNIESFLRKCLDSILSQNFKDYELLLIDDGSTDESGLICEEYHRMDPKRIHVTYQDNGGLSFARNVGLNQAKGDYIIFIDGDDFIEPYTFQRFFDKLHQNPVDVLITRMIEVYPDQPLRYLNPGLKQDCIDGKEKSIVLEQVFTKSESTWPVVQYILKRHFVLEHNLTFKEKVAHEDLDWTPMVFLFAESFACVEEYWYNHIKERAGSLNTEPKVQKVIDVIKILASHIHDDRYELVDLNQKLVIHNRMVKSLYPTIRKYRLFKKEDKEKIVRALKENKELFNYAQKKSHKLFNLICKVFGVHFGLGFTRFM